MGTWFENEVSTAGGALNERVARAAAFELLAMGLLLPKPVLACALVEGEYARVSKEVAQSYGVCSSDALHALDVYENEDPSTLFHSLRREHTRLFGQAPEPRITPYIGVWVDEMAGKRGLLFLGEKTREIERFMRRCGVAKNLAAGQVNDPVDHIGTVCEFMQYLCLVNARAVVPAEGFEVREGDFAEFHGEHFREYALWCAGRIREEEPSPFYRFEADLLESLAALPV